MNIVTGQVPIPEDPSDGLSEALKKKDREKQEKKANRRRVRGGAPAASSSRQTPAPQTQTTLTNTAANTWAPLIFFIVFVVDQICSPLILEENLLEQDIDDIFAFADFSGMDLGTDFDTHYGLLPPEETVIVKPYSDDTDDRILDEIKPRFIIMFEPCMEFVRRVEVSQGQSTYKKSLFDVLL
jgi:DNA excision repair protein ERCC-4